MNKFKEETRFYTSIITIPLQAFYGVVIGDRIVRIKAQLNFK